MRKTVCSLEGCGRVGTVRRGFCDLHYSRWRRHGDPLASLPQKAHVTAQERFWPKVNKEGPIPEYRPDLGPCWIWTAALYQKGYGHFGAFGSSHRIAYEWLVGPIPKGLFLDHLCRVPACVNPKHLEPVTNAENVRRGDTARPLSVGASNPKAKLTAEQVCDMRRLHAEGVRYQDLSAAFGVGYSEVARIITRRSWKHLS